MLLTIESHVSDLSSRISDAHFVSSTEFVFSISGVTLPPGGGSTTTSPSGDVSAVAVTAASASTSVTITLRTPESHDQIAVGAGDGIQVTFS
ncbi:MAG TPA: hypothetical protein VMR97_12035 [Acidimicrobiales bacterium]|nr:hypothetical protein [Acidimicrobiales bacterium]